MIKVCRYADALGLFDTEVISEPDHGNGSSDIVNMKVLVKCLRCAETIRIACSEVDVLCRVVSEVCSRAEYKSLYKVVLVKASSDKNTPLVVLPFVLGVCAHNSHCLLSHPVVAPHVVSEVVFIVFESHGKV